MNLSALAETDRALFDIALLLDVSIVKYVNPENWIEEKKKFFEEHEKGREYNPCFKFLPRNPLLSYIKINPEHELCLKKLNEIKTDDSAIGKLFNRRKELLKSKIELLQSIGLADKFTRKSIEFYGSVDARLLKSAEQILELAPREEKKDVSSEAARFYLQYSLNEIGFKWKVLTDTSLVSDAVLVPGLKQIRIREDAFFSSTDVLRLKIHEIETHLYRYENGCRQPFKIFGMGVSEGWQRTDEGLAVYNEELLGALTLSIIRKYAGRVLAVYYSMKYSFYESFKLLSEQFSDEDAYMLVQRAKRGLSKTVKPGAFTKDIIYLKGRAEVKEYLEKGRDIKNLYVGRVSVKEADFLPEITQLRAPEFMPDYGKDLKRE